MSHTNKDKLHKVVEEHITDCVNDPFFESSSVAILELPCDNLVDEDGNCPKWQAQIIITRCESDHMDLSETHDCGTNAA